MYSGKHLSRNTVSIYAPVQYGDHVLDPHDLYEMVHDPGASALTTLAAAVDARDKGTSGHSERVTKYAVNTAKALGLTREDVDRLQVAGLLHDVGKLGIPEEVLLKRSSLTCGEMKLVREHAAIGKAILERVPQMDIVLPAVLHHHERWDGQGYPDGLVGEHIPMLARILAVADAYDAMTSDRPYRKALLPEEAARELRKNAGVQFDAEVVEAFLNAVRESAEKKAA